MTNRQKYILDCDDDFHWYCFPEEKQSEFHNWIDIQYSDDYDNSAYGTVPEWVIGIDGPRGITFENPQIK